MSNQAKKVYHLEGLCCTSCADKIEQESRRIDGVSDAVVDFVSKRLVLYTEVSNHALIEEEARKIVKRIEPDVLFSAENVVEQRSVRKPIVPKVKLLRFIASAVLFAFVLFGHFPSGIERILYISAYLLAGYEVLRSALVNSTKGKLFDENFLMTIATLGAFAIGEYPEAVGVMLFFQVGEILQDMSVNRSRGSISELMDIRPDYAWILEKGESRKVSPESVKKGQLIIVKPGERVPLDGILIEGTTSFDTVAITGESVPRNGKVGDLVYGGFINLSGLVTLEVNEIYQESTVAKILELVQNAGLKKAPTESFITKFARVYTPIVVFLAASIALVPPFVFNSGLFSDWFYRALVFLVVSCPCALVVSVPLGYFSGIGAASKSGILMKGGNVLEAMSHVGTVIFDKTGTLTKGSFKVTQIISLGQYTEEDLLERAAGLEVHSSHPIGLAIVNENKRVLNSRVLSELTEYGGLGLSAKWGEEIILVGNSRLMTTYHIVFDPYKGSETVVYIAIDEVIQGYILIADAVKDDGRKAIQAMKEQGVKHIVMLTGDGGAVAQDVAEQLGIETFYAELLPQQKVELFEKIVLKQKRHGKVVFVGDGINDAPVLARADVGIAMGGIGSDAAIEAADMVLMTDELMRLPLAIEISRKTKRIVWQNIVFALGVKAMILLLGAMGIATMWEAVFGDVGVALIAIINSTRALKIGST